MKPDFQQILRKNLLKHKWTFLGLTGVIIVHITQTYSDSWRWRWRGRKKQEGQNNTRHEEVGHRGGGLLGGTWSGDMMISHSSSYWLLLSENTKQRTKSCSSSNVSVDSSSGEADYSESLWAMAGFPSVLFSLLTSWRKHSAGIFWRLKLCEGWAESSFWSNLHN